MNVSFGVTNIFDYNLFSSLLNASLNFDIDLLALHIKYLAGIVQTESSVL